MTKQMTVDAIVDLIIILHYLISYHMKSGCIEKVLDNTHSAKITTLSARCISQSREFYTKIGTFRTFYKMVWILFIIFNYFFTQKLPRGNFFFSVEF
jgi:hypothetical protein